MVIRHCFLNYSMQQDVKQYSAMDTDVSQPLAKLGLLSFESFYIFRKRHWHISQASQIVQLRFSLSFICSLELKVL